MGLWKKLNLYWETRQSVKRHKEYLKRRLSSFLDGREQLSVAIPFLKAFRVKEFENNFRIKLINSIYEGSTGLVLFKGKHFVGLVRIRFGAKLGKRIMSIDAIQGDPQYSDEDF